MKIQITTKDPDGVYDAVMEAAYQGIGEDDEKDALIELRQSEIGDRLKRWVRFREYLTVEFDLEAGTARVLEVAEL